MDNWFRLRHLQSISGRNVNISIKDLNCSYIFFALSTTDQENLGYFYQSSNCDNLLNPFWENVDLSFENIKRFSFLDNFLITFFLSKKNKNRILLEIKVHISGLLPISKLNITPTDDDNQIFMFQLNNNWYSFNSLESQDEIDFALVEEIPVKIKKKLYNSETIKKFLNIISDDNQQMMQTASTKRSSLESQIYHHRNRICRISQKKNKIIAIRSMICAEQRNNNMKLRDLADIKKSVHLLKLEIDKIMGNHERTGIDIAKQKSSLKRYQEIYLKISKDYTLRMYQLILELARIFPITPTDSPNPLSTGDQPSNPITVRSTDKLSICNLHLPNNDKQITINQDNSTFAAVGMVCQLLSALSKIYDIPLRYPITLDDPKISIRDYIIDIDDDERSFLLVKSAAANFRLQYAIYLLNLNIVAIRGFFSISTESSNRTLWNVSHLIKGKNRAVESGSVDMGSSNNSTHSNQINHTHSLSQNDSTDFSRSSQTLSPLVTKSCSAIN